MFGTLDVALGHYRRYSHEELKTKMEQTGFRVERILDFNRISRPPWYVSGRILKRKTLSPAQMRIFDKFVRTFDAGSHRCRESFHRRMTGSSKSWS